MPASPPASPPPLSRSVAASTTATVVGVAAAAAVGPSRPPGATTPPTPTSLSVEGAAAAMYPFAGSPLWRTCSFRALACVHVRAPPLVLPVVPLSPPPRSPPPPPRASVLLPRSSALGTAASTPRYRLPPVLSTTQASLPVCT